LCVSKQLLLNDYLNVNGQEKCLSSSIWRKKETVLKLQATVDYRIFQDFLWEAKDRDMTKNDQRILSRSAEAMARDTGQISM
jgi:hypothetical protein